MVSAPSDPAPLAPDDGAAGDLARVGTPPGSALPAAAAALVEAPAADPVLDNASWSSLTGAHAHLAIGGDLVRRYPSDVSPFIGVRDWSEPGVWSALAGLFSSGDLVGIPDASASPPQGWEVVGQGHGVQLVQTDRLAPRPDDEAVVLGAADVPEMLALVERTKPGPFLPRTHELGRYVGIRRDGELVAMAGERLQPQGWTEISAVATDPAYRRQGLASRLVLDVASHIQQRGNRALMHAVASNSGAIAAYLKLGFSLRRRALFVTVRIP